MAGDIEPLLKEVREGGLLKDFEKLTKIAAEAGSDLRCISCFSCKSCKFCLLHLKGYSPLYFCQQCNLGDPLV